jgi:uncharacterized OsmC-like protein
MGNFSVTESKQREAISEAVKAVVGQIHKNADSANAIFSAEASLHEGLLSDIQIRQFSLISDEPVSLGGTDEGPNPVELVLGAFAACQEIVIAAYAAVLDIPVQRVKVNVDGHLDLRGFFNVSDQVRPGFGRITYKTEILTSETDPAKLDQLKYFALNRCPVLDILQNPVPTEGLITITRPEATVGGVAEADTVDKLKS